MKKRIYIFMAVLSLLTLIIGCSAAEDEISSVSSDMASSAEASSDELTSQDKSNIVRRLDYMLFNKSLFGNWEGEEKQYELDAENPRYRISKMEKEDGITAVTAEILSKVWIDPYELNESMWGGFIQIWNTNEEDGALVIGRSTVLFKQDGEPFSCRFELTENPGKAFLKSETERLQPELLKGGKPDIAKIEHKVLEQIKGMILSYRYIDSPDEITLYDMNRVNMPLSLYYPEGLSEEDSKTYRMDASFVGLLPNISEVWCYVPLADYSVFESLIKLNMLAFYETDEPLYSTLRVGHTEELLIVDADTDVLDLSGVSTESLRLHSWNLGVRGFAGCERIKRLFISNTKTDIKLINRDSFPALSYLNLYFYSDSGRVRDLSPLTALSDVTIDVCLSYLAANNKTVESLKGVKLRDFVIDSQNGQYPQNEPDTELVDSMDAKRISWGVDIGFQERKE